MRVVLVASLAGLLALAAVQPAAAKEKKVGKNGKPCVSQGCDVARHGQTGPCSHTKKDYTWTTITNSNGCESCECAGPALPARINWAAPRRWAPPSDAARRAVGGRGN